MPPTSRRIFALLVVALSCRAEVADEPPSPNMATTQLCGAASDEDQLRALSLLEAEQLGSEQPIRPWVAECVLEDFEELGSAIGTFCTRVSTADATDPISPASRSLDLVKEYRSRKAHCSALTGVNLEELERYDELSDSEARDLMDRVTREWCWRPEETFRLSMEGTVALMQRRRAIAEEQVQCLERQSRGFADELRGLCNRGWDDIDDGAVLVQRWFDACGVTRHKEEAKTLMRRLDPGSPGPEQPSHV